MHAAIFISQYCHLSLAECQYIRSQDYVQLSSLFLNRAGLIRAADEAEKWELYGKII